MIGIITITYPFLEASFHGEGVHYLYKGTKVLKAFYRWSRKLLRGGLLRLMEVALQQDLAERKKVNLNCNKMSVTEVHSQGTE